ncbi:MAG TPA: type II toxin-antitoxin system VapB family antitoxin [Thermoanaerobaculia bacterium]
MALSKQRSDLQREQRKTHAPRLKDEIRVIGERCAALPVLDPRSPEEILDYDSNGLPR